MVSLEIGGREYPILYNGEAFFTIQEMLEDLAEAKDEDEKAPSIFQALSISGKEGFRLLCSIAAVLIEQGELYRRYYGFDRQAYPKSYELRTMLMPTEVPRIKQGIMDAVVQGLKMHTPEDEDVDTSLQEFRAKTGEKKH